MTLRDLRQARNLTQKRMAEMLGVGQNNISRLEGRTDMLLSTLRGYVTAMGGSLDLTIRFPDRTGPPCPLLHSSTRKKPQERAIEPPRLITRMAASVLGISLTRRLDPLNGRSRRDPNASGHGNGRGWGRGYDRVAYQGYGYGAPYGYGPYGYAPYGAPYAAPYAPVAPLTAPIAPPAPVAQ